MEIDFPSSDAIFESFRRGSQAHWRKSPLLAV
jgi:hypothetical protein